LYVIQSDTNAVPISHALHLDKLFAQFESKQLTIQNISQSEALTRTWNHPDEGVLVVHSFRAWARYDWMTFVNGVRVPLFVILTEFHTNEVLRTTFGEKNISKIIVCSEYYQKYFVKVLGFDANRVKMIYLATDDYRPPKMLRKPKPKEDHEQKVILSPSLMTLDKDYDVLLKAARKLKFKYRNLIFALYLKSHPALPACDREALIASIHSRAQVFGLGPNLRILLDTKYPYSAYLKVADVIVIPIQDNEEMYFGTLIDAVVANKAIVAPDTKLAFDLCKKDAGIYLYTTTRESNAVVAGPEVLKSKVLSRKQNVTLNRDEIVDCIVDNCSIILDSPDIKDIMEEQNNLLASNYLFPKTLPQYLNLIRRFKTNETSRANPVNC